MDNNLKNKIIKEKIGNKIKKYRKMFGFTQFKLGELAGINQRQIALIESGKSFPSLNTLIMFSQIFNCNLYDIFDIKTEEEKSEDIKISLINLINRLDNKELYKLYEITKIMQGL